MPPNPPTGPPSKEALRLALELERQGKSLEVQALRAVNAQYQQVNIRHLVALVGLVSDHAAPPERVAHLDALMGAFREAAQPLSSLGELLGQAVQAGITASANMMGVTVRPAAQAEYTQHAAQRLGLYWAKEQVRLAGEVSSVLLEGLQRGQSAGQLTGRLCERLDVSRSRSRLIAANEVSSASAYANQQSQREAGGTHYVWVTSHDERVRPAHQVRDGQVFAWDDPPSDGHPGEPVRCRCVAVPDIVGIVAEQERIRVGVHIGEVGGFSQANLKNVVLRGAQLAKLDDYLSKHPLVSVTLHSSLQDDEGPFNGDHLKGAIRISASRKYGVDFGAPLLWGELGAFSATAPNAESAMQRTFVHELGHNIIDHLRALLGRSETESLLSAYYLEAERAGRCVSQLAAVNWREYFCETLSADTFHQRELMRHDPSGYKMTQEVRALLKE